MSGTARTPRRGRGAPAPPDAHAADPWWVAEPAPVADAPAAAAPTRRRGTGRRTPSSRRDGIGWLLLGLALAPARWLASRVRHSERMRRMGVRLLVVTLVLTLLACSVGVILVNNVVIGRTAELGELDDRRRELRTNIAVLGDQLVTLSTPARIQSKATRLGMERETELPAFIYLDGGSRTLTDWQRQKVAERERRLQQQAAAAANPAAAAAETERAPTAAPAATTEAVR